MKNFLLVAAVAVFGLSNANAQEYQLGAKAGLNFATIGGDDVDGAETVTSFHVGLVGEFMFSDKFGFQPEILYSGQGSGYKNSYSDDSMGVEITETEEGTIKMDYINVPLLAKYYLMDGLYLNAGPQVGFLVSAKHEYDSTVSGGGMSESESGEKDVKDRFNTVDFGLSFGAGYKLDMGLFFDARYYLGLSNVNKELDDVPSDVDYEVAKNQNSVFHVSVGFMF